MSKTMSSAQRKAHREVLWRRQKGICKFCNKPMSLDKGRHNFATIDHVIPKSKGGPNARWNLALGCRKCNYEKKDTWINAWVEEAVDSTDLKSVADGVAVQVRPQAPTDVQGN